MPTHELTFVRKDTRMLTRTAKRQLRGVATRPAYITIQDKAIRIREQLACATVPSKRAELLEALADTLLTLAELHRLAFGPDPIPEEGGRDYANAIGSEALLMRLVADVERAASCGAPRTLTDTALESVAGPTLNRLAAEPNPTRRGPDARRALRRGG